MSSLGRTPRIGGAPSLRLSPAATQAQSHAVGGDDIQLQVPQRKSPDRREGNFGKSPPSFVPEFVAAKPVTS